MFRIGFLSLVFLLTSRSNEVLYATGVQQLLGSNHIRSIILSHDSAALCRHYEQFSLKFSEIEIAGSAYQFADRTPLVIGNLSGIFSKFQTGFGLVSCHKLNSDDGDQSVAKFAHMDDVFIKAYFALPEHFYHKITTDLSSPPSQRWPHVLRVDDIYKLKIFYDDHGNWVLEKHGSGPTHFCLEDQANVFELYPQRKSKGVGLEFIVFGHAVNKTIIDPDGHEIRFLK